MNKQKIFSQHQTQHLYSQNSLYTGISYHWQSTKVILCALGVDTGYKNRQKCSNRIYHRLCLWSNDDLSALLLRKGETRFYG